MGTSTTAGRPWLARRVVQPVAALVLCAAVGGLAQATGGAPPATTTVTATPSRAATSVLLDPASTAATERRADAARHDLHQLQRRVHYGLSAVNLRTGRRVTIGRDRFRTASLVKIHFAALQELRSKRPVADAAMIQVSDNEAADIAYKQLGGADRIERMLSSRLHVRGIDVADGSWGLSRTTATSVTDLLRIVFDRDHRDLARLRRLMASVDEEQRGGVSAAADRGTTVALKNGWLPRSDGWIVTSAGRVVVDGDPWAIAVLTDGMASLPAGMSTIGRIAELSVVAGSDEPEDAPVAQSRPTFQPVAG